MKIALLTALVLGVMHSSLPAQKIIVKSLTGKAMHASDCKQYKRRLAVGDRLDPSGCVRLTRGAKAVLVYEGKPLDLAPDRDNRLADQALMAVQHTEDGFFDNLYRFISRCMTESETEEQLRAVSAGVREKRAGIRGKSLPTTIGLNAEGLVGIKSIRIYWESTLPTHDLKLYITRKADQELLLEQDVSGATSLLLPADLELEAGASYQCQLANPWDSQFNTEILTFTYDPDAAFRLLSKLAEDPSYAAASALDRLLVMAQVMEEAGFKADAAAIWEKALDKHPKNQLVLNLAASFFARMGLPTKAASLRG